jgi:outer membrane immunogenic protein
MRMINLIAASAVALSATAGFARAADMIDETPQAPQPTFEEAVKGGWAGGYAGIYAGYGTGKFGDAVDIKAKGFGGGAFAGYNLQNGALVYGLDADVGIGRAKTNVVGVTIKQGFDASLRARLGYDLGPVMLYGAAGGILTSVKATVGAVSDSNTHLGFTVGAGADIKITDNLFARAEYRYNAYNAKSYALPAPTSVNFRENEVRFGLGLKF